MVESGGSAAHWVSRSWSSLDCMAQPVTVKHRKEKHRIASVKCIKVNRLFLFSLLIILPFPLTEMNSSTRPTMVSGRNDEEVGPVPFLIFTATPWLLALGTESQGLESTPTKWDTPSKTSH